MSHLEEVLALRKVCFPGIREILSPADLRARHLIVRNEKQEVVGTYRVTLSTDVMSFEAEEDFVIGKLLQQEGIKAELSWACVDPCYRDGRVIHLLWKTLTEFFNEHRVRYVFGLASVPFEGAQKINEIVSYLQNHSYMISKDLIQARRNTLSSQAVVMEMSDLRGPSKTAKRRVLPSLLRAYLMAGALVCVQPVFDPDLDCYDFMTVLDTETASNPLISHFKFK
ncbi:MAG: GNAT family N-acetyltransferase [Bdellovibrio sp.]|nr:GNAT family N-acetyltransferase [Bdellovibrio sp.]